jgi:delta-aminolevulinic acid dehydratase/porphobilinogen synthase
MVLIADLCVDEYTDHGHCGILHKNRRGSARQRKGLRNYRSPLSFDHVP